MNITDKRIVLFLVKLRWPKKKSIYDIIFICFADSRYIFRSIHGTRETPSSPCAYSVFLCQLLAEVVVNSWVM